MQIKSTPLGRGVFAAERFRAEQIIGEVNGVVMSTPEFARSEYGMELGAGLTLDPAPPFRFLNHSCAPNCQLFSWDDEESATGASWRLWLEALRTIQPGEELVIDYAWPADMAIPCGCQSQQCRGWIVDATDAAVLPDRTK